MPSAKETRLLFITRKEPFLKFRVGHCPSIHKRLPPCLSAMAPKQNIRSTGRPQVQTVLASRPVTARTRTSLITKHPRGNFIPGDLGRAGKNCRKYSRD